MVMKPKLGSGSESKPDDPTRSGWGYTERPDHYSYVYKRRPRQMNGPVVYTRRYKRFMRRSHGATGSWYKFLCNLEDVENSNDEFVTNSGNVPNLGGVEGNLGSQGFRDAVGKRHHDRTAGKIIRSKDENSGNLQTEEMKMSKKILAEGRPTTARELFETGLLEGYPVFYNGGNMGSPLRGTIKDSGILCSCSLCKGARVIPPCKFEIHAWKSYRRASQHICLENGKSLLDVVKECQKSSVETLEETIQNFIGPMPLKESVICRNCNGSLSATSAAKVDLLCDSCMIAMNSDIVTECAKSRSPEPLLAATMFENGEVLSTPPKRGCRGRKKRKHSELKSNMKSNAKTIEISARKKGHQKKTKMLSLPSANPKSPENALLSYSKSSSDIHANDSSSLHGSLKDKTTRKSLKKLSNTSPCSKSLYSGPPSVSRQSKTSLKMTKRDQRMHKLVFEDGGLANGTKVSYYSHGKKSCEGYKEGSRIMCSCCNTPVSPSQFEAHAGWASRRKPYMYIYTDDGVSLHDYAIRLLKGREFPSKDNANLCIICADGGNLVFCEGCPRAFHKECASLLSVPRDGKWYCTYCQNIFQREKSVKLNANAVAATRVSLTDRCTRIVKNIGESKIIACVICRDYDFSTSGFGPRTVILCDQCEREYHIGCLKEHEMADLKELPQGKWLCSENCEWMHSQLQILLNTGEQKLLDSSLDIIKKKLVKNSLVADVGFDVRWRLLKGKVATSETRVLLSQVVAILHDNFDPIVDPETGRDLIPSLVYGRNISGQDFSGMYCAILTVNSTVVSAGVLRIFGQEIAELPLAATHIGYQRKGYFQIFYNCIEKLLAYLHVKSFVLPATDGAKSIWTEKFGFEKIPEEKLSEYRKDWWQMISFMGTSMLEKRLPKCHIINDDQSD